MKNKDFYAFCRDQRKVETDVQKREALKDVYKYMWECGITKRGVTQYIALRVEALSRQAQPIDAYIWLSSVFAK